MNIHRLCKSIYWIMLVGSSGLLLLSVNAVSFGLDADGKWGEPRVGLFLIGITGILVSVFLILADKLDQRHAPPALERNYGTLAMTCSTDHIW